MNLANLCYIKTNLKKDRKYEVFVHMIQFKPFVWPSNPPKDIPFENSESLKGIKFTGISSDYAIADTWYPSWASDDKLYSPYTDGVTDGIYSYSACFTHNGLPDPRTGWIMKKSATGNGVMIGDDPVNLEIKSLGVEHAEAMPYGGRYPCGSLVYNGYWYYGTYCLSPYGTTKYGNTTYNWPHLGPFVGFRISDDYGKSWKDCPHSPIEPLFGENGMLGHPVKIGAPHFVDFGKNMEHSPDGKAYLLAQGSDLKFYPPKNFAHLSWITADQTYLIRVEPSPQNMNDPSAYEFFAGYDKNNKPLWTKDFNKIEPLLEWQDNMGCVTATYNPGLKKYIMAITDGVNTCSKMNTYLLEADTLTGPWKLITYMKDFGEQAYFVNFPSKFISKDGHTMWICYSGNFATGWNDVEIKVNPPGSRYGLVLQEVELLR